MQAQVWKSLEIFDLNTSIVHRPVDIFMAAHLSLVGTQPEGTEAMQTCAMKLTQAIDLVIESTMTHAPRCVLILKAAHLQR